MTPELKYFIDYHKTKRPIRWTPLAVAELVGMLGGFALLAGVGYVGCWLIGSMF